MRHVMPIALAFMAEYPEVTINLITADRLIHMVDEHVDVAIRLGHLADSALFAVKVGDFRLITCASSDYLERSGTPLDPRDLPAHDGIMFGTQQMFWTYHIGGADMICAPRMRVTVNSAAGNLAAALGGVGIARLFNYQLAGHIQSGALVRVLPDGDSEPRPVHIVYPRQGLMPLKVRAFIDWMTPRLRAACTRFDCP